jgi:predicted Zn finger-like uncharacterized protein
VVARCPQCQTRFRLAPDKVGPTGARIRCSRCQTIFRVAPPATPADAAAEPEPEPEQVVATPPVAPVPAPRAAAPAPRAPAPPPEPPAPPPAPARPRVRILVAESDAEAAKKITEVLNRWNLAAEVVHDGGEALLWLHRNQPPAAVLGGHLRGLSSPAIAEIVKRTSELRGTKLIRIAPLDEPVGAPEFEAERIVEPGELAIGLETALEALGVGERPGAPASGRPAARPAPAARSAAPPDPRVAAAERLARIIVSDIILYNQEKFQRAAADGSVAAALDAELMEASVLFRQRIPEEVRANRDFLVEELERRAKAL